MARARPLLLWGVRRAVAGGARAATPQGTGVKGLPPVRRVWRGHCPSASAVRVLQSGSVCVWGGGVTTPARATVFQANRDQGFEKHRHHERCESQAVEV